LLAKIEAILVSDFGKILNSRPDGLTLSKIREEKACLYIGLSTQGYGETATAVGKLFLGELLYNSYRTLSKSEEEGLKNPISIYFDEFGSLVTPEFIELQNKCRGAGMELTLAVQSAADIDRINPDLTRQVIENAGNLFILKQRLQDGAALFSEAIGTVMTKKQTYRVENGQQQNLGTEREAHELLVHPDVIKNLNIGQCVLLRQGPSQINLLNIRNRKMDAIKRHNKQNKSFHEFL
ncbi:MAG: TraM recognition domain-containing protein, partial [Bdellovibrionota bacterium]